MSEDLVSSLDKLTEAILQTEDEHLSELLLRFTDELVKTLNDYNIAVSCLEMFEQLLNGSKQEQIEWRSVYVKK